MALKLSVALADYDRTRPLLDGRVKVAGCEATMSCLGHEEMFTRATSTADFDVTEMSFSRYSLTVAQGQSAYIGIPVFLSRVFRHSSIYIRADRGIKRPQDLKGKIIGVRNYANTVTLVARGVVEDEFGVTVRNVKWLVGDVDRVESHAPSIPKLPPDIDVKLAPQGRLLDPMLAAGEIDGFIDFQPPPCFTAQHPQVTRLFPDYEAQERDYFRRSGVFPIMHVLGLRKTLAEQHQELPRALYEAFVRAKAIALDDLWQPGALKITLPWVSEEYQRTIALMGNDFWAYGIEKNRAAIAAIARYVHAQGLAPFAPTPEQLFDASLLQT